MDIDSFKCHAYVLSVKNAIAILNTWHILLLQYTYNSYQILHFSHMQTLCKDQDLH